MEGVIYSQMILLASCSLTGFESFSMASDSWIDDQVSWTDWLYYCIQISVCLQHARIVCHVCSSVLQNMPVSCMSVCENLLRFTTSFEKCVYLSYIASMLRYYYFLITSLSEYYWKLVVQNKWSQKKWMKSLELLCLLLAHTFFLKKTSSQNFHMKINSKNIYTTKKIQIDASQPAPI